MLTLRVRQWSERPRMLLFMLAVILPAAALIIFSVIHLRSVQREKAIEAVIQRDDQQVLAIAEKRIVERAYQDAEEARAKFPNVDHSNELGSSLTTHSDIAHAFLWTEKGSLDFRSQSGQWADPDFREESKKLSSMVGNWFDMESKDFLTKLKRIKATDGRYVYITSNWVPRGDKWQYQSLVPQDSTDEHPALAGFAYDADYLRTNSSRKR